MSNLYQKYFDLNRRVFLPLLLLLTAIIFYFLTMLPGLGHSGDTAKFQFIGKVLGIPHPPGYPLYVMLNKLFIQIPLGTIAFRVNLMSLVFSVLTLLILYLLLNKLLKNDLIAFSSSLILAFTKTFWSQSLVAEVYSLNSLLLILLFYLLVSFQQEQKPKFLYLFFFFYALSFGNHLTMITIFPAIFIFLNLVSSKILYKFKTILIALLSVFIGASQYLFLFVRTYQKAPYLEKSATDLSSFFDIIMAKQFQKQMFAFSFPEIFNRRIPLFLKMFRSEFTIFLILIGLIGFIVLYRKNRKLFVLLSLSLLGELVYLLNYKIHDLSWYFLPLILIFTIFIAHGLNYFYQSFNKLKIDPRFFFIIPLVIVAFLVIDNYSDVDQSGDVVRNQKYTVLFENIPDNSVIISVFYWQYHFVNYKSFIEYPDKKIFHLKLFKNNHNPNTFKRIMKRTVRNNKNLNISTKQLLNNIYLHSERAKNYFSKMGFKTVKIIFKSKKNKKRFTFFKILNVEGFIKNRSQ
jgi:hypothetical protein